MLAEQADRHTRVEGAEMVRSIDSSPVPLGKMATGSNGTVASVA